MSKKTFQDILSSSKSTIKVGGENIFAKKIFKEKPSFQLTERGDSGGHNLIIWGIAAFSVLVALFFFFSFFEKAHIKITPKQQVIPLKATFSAHRGNAITPGGLTFEIMTLSGEEKKTLPATEVEQVEKEASGKIIIYNNFDSKSQKLITQTRFETPEGLIYRVRESVTVGGQKTINGEKVPGSIEVTVYADRPGDKHNIGLTDFTIPGFKGTPRFGSFYARSKTPMVGGFSGIVKTVSKTRLKSVEQELVDTLRARLLVKAHSQKPDNFILYDDAVFFGIEEGARAIEANVNKDEVDVLVSGTLHGLIFNEKILSQFLGKTLLPDIGTDEKVFVQNLNSLVFTISNKELFSPTEDSVLSFTLAGNPHTVWEFNKDLLVKDTLSQPKSEFKKIMTKYQNIGKAELVIRPFWKRSFPDDPSKIEIETIIEE
ncbi:MAG: hypothetical protein Q8R36_04795 [bacterium]|nr:hypothetical protein [bacterium]